MKSKQKQINKASFRDFFIHKELLINSLLVILIGIFLLPQFAYSSEINNNNIIDLTNKERGKLGIAPLNRNIKLERAAQEKANYILSTQKFQHNIGEMKFSDWIKQQDYQYTYVGENLAIDFISSEGIIEAWKNSPLHYKNLINSGFKEIGVAVVNGNFHGQNTALVVQIFGTPADVAANSADKNISLSNIFPSKEKQILSNVIESPGNGMNTPKLLLLSTEKNNIGELNIDLAKTSAPQNYAHNHGFFSNLEKSFHLNAPLYYILNFAIILLLLYCYIMNLISLNKNIYG